MKEGYLNYYDVLLSSASALIFLKPGYWPPHHLAIIFSLQKKHPAQTLQPDAYLKQAK